jgi:hypothetical protein
MQRSSCIHKNIHQLVTHSYDSHSSQIKNFLEFYVSVENGKNRELDAFNQLVAGKEKKKQRHAKYHPENLQIFLVILQILNSLKIAF